MKSKHQSFPAALSLPNIPQIGFGSIETFSASKWGKYFGTAVSFLLVKACIMLDSYTGEAGVGKTSITKRFATESFTSAYMHTIGIDFDEKVVEIGGKRVRLQVRGPCQAGGHLEQTSRLFSIIRCTGTEWSCKKAFPTFRDPRPQWGRVHATY